jgi:signal transduction histidine kinase
MTTMTTMSTAPRPRGTLTGWIARRVAGAAHALGLWLLAAVQAAIVVVMVLTAGQLILSVVWGDSSRPWLGAIVLVPLGMWGIRRLATRTRRLVERWCGVSIPTPYRSARDDGEAGPPRRLRHRVGVALTDPATWRDVLWAAMHACVITLVATPIALVISGVSRYVAERPDFPGGTVRGPVFQPIAASGNGFAPNPLFAGMFTATFLCCLGAVALGLLIGPRLLWVYGTLARTILGPTRRAALTLRVDHLTRTRSDTLEGSAAELRRIERDLHDGTQARLVAMGMTLSAAEQLVETSPEAARQLLVEARDASAKALAELRDLVRGIHPPVLADRGLVDAVHALALDLPLRVHFAGELPGRPPEPVESAAYFAASELLANVSKHAAATQVWIDISHRGGMLRVCVSDDGRGGADPALGTGLRGLERRLAAFDGVLAINSPAGGPTLVNLEIPCALSSPKTFSS